MSFFNLSFNTDILSIENTFNEDIYDSICSLHYDNLNEINYLIEPSLCYDSEDECYSYIYNLKDNLYYFNSQFEFNPNKEAFNIKVDDEFIICNFISPLIIHDKLIQYENRYYTIEVNLENKGESHSVLFVFDTYKRQSFVIDSNSNLNFCKYEFEGNIISHYLHRIFKHYSNGVDYNYKKIDRYNFIVNYKLESDSQKQFFDGYCRAWSFYFIILVNNNEIDLLKYIKELGKMDINILNSFIEKFQVYFYNKFTQYIL